MGFFGKTAAPSAAAAAPAQEKIMVVITTVPGKLIFSLVITNTPPYFQRTKKALSGDRAEIIFCGNRSNHNKYKCCPYFSSVPTFSRETVIG
jgi:hypothetical protein